MKKIMNNFFKLSTPPSEWVHVGTQDEFISIYNSTQNIICALIYYPETLSKTSTKQYLKIKQKKFCDCSFKNTRFDNVYFENCEFNSCLFMSTTFCNCKFISCHFTNVNTLNIKFIDTYVDPRSFISAIPSNSFIQRLKIYTKKKQNDAINNFSNIGVQLFQALLDDCKERSQLFFSLEAEYQFRRWDRILHEYSYFNKVGGYSFSTLFLKTIWGFVGYGIKIRRYMATLLLLFCSVFLINIMLWKSYFHINKIPSTDLQCILQYTFYSCFSIGATPNAATTWVGIILAILQGALGWLLIGIGVGIITKRVVG